MRGIIALLLCCIANEANGQAVRVRHEFSYCKGTVCNRYRDYGTGTIIYEDDKGQYILAAGHTFRGNPTQANYQSIAVQCGISRFRNCDLIAVVQNKNADLALLRTRGRQFDCTPATLSPPMAVPTGETISFNGFGDKLQPAWGSQIAVVSGVTQGGSEYAQVSVRQGDSGGPVKHHDNLYGVTWGSTTDGSNRTYYTPMMQIWPFLQRHCPPCVNQRYRRLPAPPPVERQKPAAVVIKEDPRIKALEEQVAELQAVVEQLTLKSGPAGPVGATGPAGATGATGNDGAPGEDASPFIIKFRSQSKRNPSKYFDLGSVNVTGPGEYTIDLPDVKVIWHLYGKELSRQSFPAGTPVLLDLQWLKTVTNQPALEADKSVKEN